MQVADLTVEVRNSSLARVGQILPTDLVGLELALRFNRLGSWKVTLRSDHPLVDSLRAPGSGLIVTGPNGVLISGPTVQATQNKTGSDPTGTWEVIGVDDSVVLGERLAYPVPTTTSLTAQSLAYDSRTGKAETVAKAYVNANIGPSAPTGRRITSLTVDTDLARGNTVVSNARFDKLGELLYGILTPSGLGFDIDQSGSTLVFRVYQPTDRSATVRMDVDNLRLSKSEYTYSSPNATRVIVAGQGQGSARTLIERTSAASTTAEASWGRRIEVFKDARNTNDTTELNTAGDEILAEQGFTIEGIKVTPSDDIASMQFGVHWNLGDKVTVVVGNAEVAKIVTEAAIVVTPEGVKVGATVGDPDTAANDMTSTLVSGQTSQEARISNLERNDAVFVQTGNIADLAVTNAKLATPNTTINGTSIPLGSTATITAAPSGTASGDLTGTYPGPTLAAVGTAGTYDLVTTDAKGRVISGRGILPAPQTASNTTQNVNVTATAWGTAAPGGIGTISLTLSAAAIVQVDYSAWMASGAISTDLRAQVLYSGTSSNSAPFPNWGAVLFNNGLTVSSVQSSAGYVVQLAAGTYTFTLQAYKNGTGAAYVNYSSFQVTPLRWA